MACYSCKAFFRRKVTMNQALTCIKSDNCQVTKENRKNCKKCRLKKCYKIGMKATWVMTDEEKREKETLVERKKHQSDPDPASVSSYDERMRYVH